MIYHDVEHGESEWAALRLGIPTSSNFSKILTPAELKLSKSWQPYMCELLADWINGGPTEDYQSFHMQRGTELESGAVAAYESETDLETKRGGFITTDDGMVGCSPDRLVGDYGDVETKCPMLKHQIEFALKPESMVAEHVMQVQGRLWIHKRKWVDVFAYHPRLILPPQRVVAIAKYQDAFDRHLPRFVDELLENRLRLEREFGPFARPDPEPEPQFAEFISPDEVEAILDQRRGAL